MATNRGRRVATVTSTRQSDSPNIKVSREIPLWGLVCALGLGATFCISLYYNILSQNEKLIVMQASLSALNNKVESFNTTQSASGLKDLEHDLKITNLTNRLVVIEGVLQRQLPVYVGPMQQQLQNQQNGQFNLPQQIPQVTK